MKLNPEILIRMVRRNADKNKSLTLILKSYHLKNPG